MHGSSPPLRILVVDGDASSSGATCDALRWDRCDVAVTSTAEDALATARRVPPDVVIVAASLAKATVAALRADGLSRLPVIALSSGADAPLADAVLRTPVDALELLATVRLLAAERLRG